MHWADEVGIGDSGYVETGYLLPVPEALVEAARGNVARLAALGLETSFVEPAEIAEIEPLLALDGIAGAAYEPDGGFADAHKMILGWFAAGYAHGLEARFGCAATRADRRGRPRARRAHARRRHRLRPRRARDGRLGARAARAARRRRPDRAQAHPGRRAAPAGRRAAAERRLLRRRHERRRAPRSRRAVLRRDVLRRRAARRRRRLRPRRLARLRGGHPASARPSATRRSRARPGSAPGRAPYDYSPDWNPIVGEAPGVEGLHLALAWSGHGFKLSPAVGEVVAAEVVGDEPRDRRHGAAADALRRGASSCASPTGPARAPDVPEGVLPEGVAKSASCCSACSGRHVVARDRAGWRCPSAR